MAKKKEKEIRNNTRVLISWLSLRFVHRWNQKKKFPHEALVKVIFFFPSGKNSSDKINKSLGSSCEPERKKNENL